MRPILFVLAVLVLMRVQGAPDGAPTVPELEALRGQYQRNLAAITTARGTRTEAIRRTYAADLDRLQHDITSSGDLDGALQVKAERQRLETGREPTAIERRAMPAALGALRTRYDKDLQPILAPLRDAEEQQKRAYVAALDNLQRQLTIQNQLDKAMLVRTEREGLAGPSAEKAPPEPAPPSVPLSPSAVAGAGQLDAKLAGKIAGAIRDKKLFLTETSMQKGGGGEETFSEGAVLVGFEFFETKSNGFPDIRSLRPIYLTPAGIKEGTERGKMEKVTNKVMARAGYSVGGIQVYHTNNEGKIQGIQVIFMKMNPNEGRLDHDSSNTYRSLWFGSIPRKEKPKILGGDGRPVVGVYGFRGANCDVIGLIQTAD